MRSFFCFLLFYAMSWGIAQNNPFQISCLDQDFAQISIGNADLLAGTNCGNTSMYSYQSSLYLPNPSDEIIYIKLNFIFLTKPDGTGNFDPNNQEHQILWDEIISRANQTLLNLDGSPTTSCQGYGQNNLTNTKFQIIVNKIWKVDPAWDYLQTGFVPCSLSGSPITCTGFNKLYPPTSEYYYSYYDNDPTIPEGINVVFANNGNVYNEIVNNHNYTSPGGQGWAASQSPSETNLSEKLRQFFPDTFNGYLTAKYYHADNPDPNSPVPNTPWSVVRSWYVTNMRKGILHEMGHNFDLGHENNCFPNIMNQNGVASGNYLYNQQISTMYFAASKKSVRQFISTDSFKNTNLNVTSNELWDLNFRLYSNVKIDNNSSLKATCKIIMAPDSRFIVKDGSNFIIEGAEIISANNTSWNGIKVEGNGYLLINPNTFINTNHFYAYADNTPLSNGKASNNFDKINKNIIENSIVDKDYRIYPNPTGDFINIDTKNNISKVEVYNLLNKSFSSMLKDNRIDVRNLPQGNYILKIYSSSGEKTIHFIKK
ncbi:T9SS type A sorting domain-containing protein [Epilithonimonas zeae]|uniref:T9SS type A sorting domain-containing protein n=1 Tax=Epilithonimonas zeae TaxID=1416779 RepID=UPI00200C3DA4|nr:T9SS type A sorting domain-containing protein [Epilithonimonas zeae]UQB70375.1 T9SS type A sorting domain-containing protein [Epilithonimonas zeae]